MPALLRDNGLRPSKGLGQNCLIDHAALNKIVAAAEVGPHDTVLEIGPGLGSLTRFLAQAAQRVVAVELDQHLIPLLSQVLAPWPNVEIIHGDILQLDPDDLLAEGGYSVVANIPYYITSAVLRHLLEAGHRPARLVLTIQQEVAERICAPAGDLSLLALSVQVYGQPQRVLRIPAGAFYPAPKVDSAVVRIDLYPQPRIPAPLLESFFRLARAGFSQKRKTLRNSLAGGMQWPTSRTAALLEAADIDPRRRAETLDLEEWRRLAEAAARAES
ncbi:MAG: 16S rRNA (adenine(1518)-N(6)/adenine(1519)-N(6))-dimethyltransferase RsmA [Anaerolineaceae bacterium]|nr:16S rRNA (adenine(1518)-N(6)/adenine(1519)-N(6))-dimethyltransferase RsmA [Anaerolineaceae bacterium]